MKEDYLKNWYDMSNDIVALTGASGKLGTYYAKLIIERKARVALIDCNEESLLNYYNSLDKQMQSKCKPFVCDISIKEEVCNTFREIKHDFGNVSVLINNAAAHQVTFLEGSLVEFEEFPIEVWQSNLDVNLTGAFLCCQEAGKHMLENKKGVILNIGSTYGVVACDQRIYGDSGLNSNVAYAATKSGIINFTRYLASYWQGKNIRVNCLSPGGVYNNQPKDFYENYVYRTMLKRMAKPDDLGSAVLYLVSDASDWVTGINHIVDGGFTAW